MAPSQLAKASTATGIQASGEIIRRNWNGTWVSSRIPANRPIPTPTGTPITTAHSSPSPMRSRLGRVACQT